MLLFLASAMLAQALGPHEILLLVNSNSARSKEVANAFVRFRNVPPQNVVYLSLPPSVLEPSADIATEDFTRCIWDPANAAMRERGIGDHILAWVYSVDFPIRVKTEPAMSIQGLTFTRNNIVPSEAIQKGASLSQIYAGPDAADKPGAPAHTLDRFAEHLRGEMPLPSMMLGFAGSRGSSVEQVVSSLRNGMLADHTAPAGTVFYVVNDDVRSKCRDWQYAGAQKELEALRVASRVGTEFPDALANVIGVFSGQAWMSPDNIGRARPGCVADHLTSFSAVFDNPDQSKATEWLNVGATASAGTVTEPLAIWTKFPHARFFVHYAYGCTILESFFQAIRCPLQILLLGDPLARPWAPRLAMVLVCVDEGAVSGKAMFHAQSFPGDPQPPPDYQFLLDGRTLGTVSKPDIEIPVENIADGYHEMRVVAYSQGGVRHQSAATCGFTLNRNGRSVSWSGVATNADVDLYHPLRARVGASGKPARVGIACGEIILGMAPAGDEGSAEVVADPRVIGLGPSKLQAFAEYADGTRVRGEPVPVKVGILDKPPTISRFDRGTNQQGQIVFTPVVADAEKDAVESRWFQVFPAIKAASGRVETTSEGIRVVPPAEGFGIALDSKGSLAGVEEIASRVSFIRNWPNYKNQLAGLVFDFKDNRNFSFFGLWGDACAWALGRCENGTITWKTSRGTAILPDRDFLLSVRAIAGGGIECRVNDEVLFEDPAGSLGSGPPGFLAKTAAADFKEPALSPPAYPAGAFRADGQTLIMEPSAPARHGLLLRASDSHLSSWKRVP